MLLPNRETTCIFASVVLFRSINRNLEVVLTDCLHIFVLEFLEVLDNLQEILNDMRVTARSANRVQLESETHQAAD